MRKLVIGLIRLYQKYISANTAPCCRFSPTCSQYGIEAVERFGVIKGGAMTLWRILRCNPWNPGGYDPVPEKSVKRIGKYKFIEYKAEKKKKRNHN